mmetsp:Transcript_23294/g.52309  ORF Transcript_23294/g.52309 Transcript_23294/m.52309 type:complete len:201 (+) Transcript_23294:3043-3645(+)
MVLLPRGQAARIGGRGGGGAAEREAGGTSAAEAQEVAAVLLQQDPAQAQLHLAAAGDAGEGQEWRGHVGRRRLPAGRGLREESGEPHGPDARALLHGARALQRVCTGGLGHTACPAQRGDQLQVRLEGVRHGAEHAETRGHVSDESQDDGEPDLWRDGRRCPSVYPPVPRGCQGARRQVHEPPSLPHAPLPCAAAGGRLL